MKLKIDPEICIGCGSCSSLCPEVFKMNDEEGKAVIIKDADFEKNKDCIKESIDVCPVQAISEVG